MSEKPLALIGNISEFESFISHLEEICPIQKGSVHIIEKWSELVADEYRLVIFCHPSDRQVDTETLAPVNRLKSQIPVLGIFNRELYSDEYLTCFDQGIDEVLRQSDTDTNSLLRALNRCQIRFEHSRRMMKQQLKTEKQINKIKDQTNARNQLLANLSKEIRTPLTGIMGSTQLLLDGRLDHEQRELSEMILNSSNQLLDALNGVLDMAKLEVGELQLDIKDYPIDEFLEHCFFDINQSAIKKGKQFSIQSKFKPGAWYQFDTKRLQYLLSHLGEWAMADNESGSIVVEVAETQEGVLEFKYRDEAADIFDADLTGDKELLFDHRLKAFDLEYCKELASLMGGELRTIDGDDPTLRFSLVIEAEQSKSPKEKLTKEKQVRRYVGRVVVAEDNLINQKVITKLLNSLGIKPVIAFNGKVALEEVQKEGTDLVLMDLQMPVMNGFQATTAIRNLGENIKQPIIVACSANVLEEVLENSWTLGMDGFLKKPLSKESLIKELDRWLPNQKVDSLKNLGKLTEVVSEG